MGAGASSSPPPPPPPPSAAGAPPARRPAGPAEPGAPSGKADESFLAFAASLRSRLSTKRLRAVRASRESGVARQAGAQDTGPPSLPLPVKARHALVLVDAREQKAGYATVTKQVLASLEAGKWTAQVHTLSKGGLRAADDAAAVRDATRGANGARAVFFCCSSTTATEPVYGALQEVRRAGVLVANLPRPGPPVKLVHHLPRHDAPPKRAAVRRLGLSPLLSTDDDGFKELPVYITSGPSHDGEREALHARVLPALQRRCRHWRVRLVPVDLRTHWPNANAAGAAEVAEACRKGGCVHVHLWSDCRDDSAASDAEDIHRWVTESRHDLARDEALDWLRTSAPGRYTRAEIELVHLLGLHKPPVHYTPDENDGDGDGDVENQAANGSPAAKGQAASLLRGSRSGGTAASAQASAAAASNSAALSAASVRKSNALARLSKLEAPLHSFVYARSKSFESAIVGTPAAKHYVSSDPRDAGRLAELFAAVYAHPYTQLRTYECTHVAEVRPTHEQAAYVKRARQHEAAADPAASEPPRLGVRGAPLGGCGHAPCASPAGYCGGLADDFERQVAEDLWSVVEAELEAPTHADRAVVEETSAVFGLRSAAFPLLFRRRHDEHTLTKCVKLARPPLLVLSGRRGSGCSTIMLACARILAREYATVRDVVIVSHFVGVAGAKGGASRTLESVLRSLIFSIGEHCPDLAGVPVPGIVQDLVFLLHALLRAVVSRGNRRIAILIDGFDEIDNPACISWLPPEDELPFGVQFIIAVGELPKKRHESAGAVAATSDVAGGAGEGRSSLDALNPPQASRAVPAQTLVAARQRRLGLLAGEALSPAAFAAAVKLEPLPYHERKTFAARVFKLSGMTLPELHQTALTSKFDMGLGQFCSTMSEELAHAWHADMTPAEIEQLPVKTRDVLVAVLSDAEGLYGRDLIATMLAFLSYAPGGLAVSDVKNMLRLAHVSVSMPSFDALVLPRLLRRLHQFVRQPIGGILQLAHPLANAIAIERYALDQPLARDKHIGILIQHFVGETALALRDCHTQATHFLERHGGRQPERVACSGLGHVLDYANMPAADAGLELSDDDIADHRLIVAMRDGPVFLAALRRFDKLTALFTDLSYIAGKVLLGFGPELLRDLDAMLGYVDATAVTGAPLALGAVAGDRPRLFPLQDAHAATTDAAEIVRAFRSWATGPRATMLEKMRDMRTFLRAHLNAIARRANQLPQLAYNYADDSLPRRLAVQHFAGVMAASSAPQKSQAEGAAAAAAPAGAPLPVGALPHDASTGATVRCALLVANRVPNRVVCVSQLRGHLEQVLSLVSTATGFYVSGSEDGTARVWDASFSAQVLALRGHTRAVRGVAYHRARDVATGVDIAATASDDGTVKLWDLTGGGAELATLEGHEDRVTCCTISADGGVLLSGSADATLRLWNMETHACLETFKGHDAGVTSVAFAPLGGQVLSSSWDGTAALWFYELGEPSRMLGQMRGHSACVAWTCYDPHGKLVATASHDGTAALWEPGMEAVPSVKGICIGHNAPLTSCAFDSEGVELFTASLDGTVRLWDLATLATLRVLPCHDAPINAISLSADNAVLATASDDGVVRVWAQIGPGITREPCEVLDLASVLDGEPRVTSVTRTSWRPNRTAALSKGGGGGGGGGASTASLAPPLPWEGDTQQVRGLCFVPSLASWVTALGDTTLRVYNEGCTRETHQLHGHSQAVTACASCAQTSDVLAACEDHNAVVWSVPNAEEQALLNGHTTAVVSCAWNAAGTLAATGDKKGVVKLWDTASPEGGLCPELASVQAHDERITHVAMQQLPSANAAATDAVFATCATGGAVKVWSVSGSGVTEIAGQSDGVDAASARHPGHAARCTSCALHSSDDHSATVLVTTSYDGALAFWDWRRERVLQTTRLVSKGLACGACSSARPWLAFGIDDTVALFDIRKLDRSFAEFSCERNVVAVCFHAGGGAAHALAAADAAGRLYNLHLCAEPVLA